MADTSSFQNGHILFLAWPSMLCVHGLSFASSATISTLVLHAVAFFGGEGRAVRNPFVLGALRDRPKQAVTCPAGWKILWRPAAAAATKPTVGQSHATLMGFCIDCSLGTSLQKDGWYLCVVCVCVCICLSTMISVQGFSFFLGGYSEN